MVEEVSWAWRIKETNMDNKTFKTLMKLFDIETVEILGDAAFAVEVMRIAESGLAAAARRYDSEFGILVKP